MSRYKYPFIVKDSKQNIYKFSMNENNNLILEKFYENTLKTKNILRENIRNFVADIDNKDVVHVMYVDESNRIKYSVYSTVLVDNINFSIKDENNDYRFLFFKFIIDRLYLFFIARPFNNDQCILKSCVIKNNNITVKDIITVSCSKYTCPFYIYSSSEYIYILYSKNSNEKYTLQILDAHKNRWHEYSNTIILNKASHINFIVKGDTALICYNSFQNKNMELQLTSINLKISPSLVNEPILLSNANRASIHPLILTFKNEVWILWEEGEKFTFYNFIYNENIVVKKQYISIKKSEIHYANYRSNFSESLKLNSTVAYILQGDLLNIIADFKSFIKNETLKIPTENTSNKVPKEKSTEILKEPSVLEEISYDTESISYTPINIDFLEITPYLNDYIKELYRSTNNTSELLSNYIEENKKLNDKINYLIRLNSSYKCRIEEIKNRFAKYRNDSSTMLMKYVNAIADVDHEKKKLINIIDDQETKILSLQHIIDSYDK